jgi:hypothetical protein
MACPDFEELVRNGAGSHAARCERCAALLEALADVDATLCGAYGNITAPPALSAAVRLRIDREQARRGPSLLPEILDFIGWAALLALIATLAPRFLPLVGAALSRIGQS